MTKTFRFALLASTLLGGAASAQDVTLTIESWRNDDLTIWQDKLIPAFEAANPGIKVVFAPTAPAEYNAALNSKLAAGSAGDLAVAGIASIPLAGTSLLAHLNLGVQRLREDERWKHRAAASGERRERSQELGVDERAQAEAQARALLGLGREARREEIIDAHRRLIAQVHPDRGGSSEAVHRANAARDLLLARLAEGK